MFAFSLIRTREEKDCFCNRERKKEKVYSKSQEMHLSAKVNRLLLPTTFVKGLSSVQIEIKGYSDPALKEVKRVCAK